jgi:formylglycine-generating enzyme required for sulfatase activity
VGSLSPNRCGFYDLSGSIHELMNDWYSADAYSTHSPIDPIGPLTGEFMVRRGGTWWDMVREVRLASRQWYTPDFIDSHPGFRIARTADE